MYAAQTTSSILNGFGKTKQTLYHNLLGVGIRIFFILLLIPSKGIPGYLIGLLAGYSLQLLLNLFRIYQIVPFYFSAEKTLLFPVITAIGGGILSKKFWGIASAASACSTGDTSPSHVLTAMGIPEKLARGTLRLTIGYQNTREEIDYTVQCIKEAVEKLRENAEDYRRYKETFPCNIM